MPCDIIGTKVKERRIGAGQTAIALHTWNSSIAVAAVHAWRLMLGCSSKEVTQNIVWVAPQGGEGPVYNGM